MSTDRIGRIEALREALTQRILVIDGAMGLLRDPFSAKPFVIFYSIKRVGGDLRNSEAIKMVKFAAA